ncbi:MAG: primosomal protein N' [Phycisphaeraceae bacterium]
MPDLFADNAPPGTGQPVGRFALVAIERGVDAAGSGLTYAVPEDLSDLAVGDRVVVPLGRGNKPVHGFVVALTSQSEYEGGRIKPILSRAEGAVSLPPDLIELARWISAYYCCPLGMVFGSMMPAAVKRGTGTVHRPMVRFLKQPEESVRLSKLQRKALAIAREQRGEGDDPKTGWLDVKTLADLAGAKTTGPVKQLIDGGWLEVVSQARVVSDLDLRAQEEIEPAGRFTLNRGQRDAIDHLTRHLHEGFGVHLLHGVTGSGKTEVYLRLIEAAIDMGVNGKDQQGEVPGAIVLVPEIALTPQTVGRFLGRFAEVAVLHSGLTPAQRHAQWRRIRDGQASIVVGARSAVFAPVRNLRLIIVDEEHESSYKQDQLPRYHARDVAIKRGQMLGVPVVLGSATPSLESYYNATGGMANGMDMADGKKHGEPASAGNSPSVERRPNYHLIRLPERAPGMRLPDVQIVDMQEERRHRRGIHLLSRRLEQELERVLQGEPGATHSTRGQAMLLLNRRGYANYVACPDHRCGWMMRCQHCDATVVYHKDKRLPTGGYVRCHHCDAEQLLVTQCPESGHKITVFGLGTQKVEEEIVQKFPGVRVARMDSDTMRNARDYQQTLDRFRAGEIDVLLGTQMIAKGLDFPGVRLVGVISADTALHLPDFRASERTFQLISQVAGRCGRSEHPGRVVVQTFSPNDPAITLAAAHDYDTFAKREIALRAEVGLPPISRMARIVVRDKDHVACYEYAKQLYRHLETANTTLKTGVRLRGPAPCPIARIADYHRQQIELIAGPPKAAARLQQLMTSLRNSRLLISDARTAVDVDPVALL